MLHRPEAFEPLTGEPWDDARVRGAIRAVAADADAAFDPDGLWPAHEWDGWRAALPMKSLSVGASGVVWALDELRRRGHAETSLDLRAAALRALELWRAAPDFMDGEEPPAPGASSLLRGESGILLVALRLEADGVPADDLLARVRANVDNPADKLVWGAAGTLLAAARLHASTGEERWAAAVRASADALHARRPRPRPPRALDGRRRHRALRFRLPRRPLPLSGARQPG